MRDLFPIFLAFLLPVTAKQDANDDDDDGDDGDYNGDDVYKRIQFAKQ